jgi:hypothetical protein
MLRKGGQGEREKSDCGPEHHGSYSTPDWNLMISGQWSLFELDGGLCYPTLRQKKGERWGNPAFLLRRTELETDF